MTLAGEIKRLEDWYYKAGPKNKETQWKNDFSAKEFAKLWFRNEDVIQVPKEIEDLIKENYGVFKILFAIPEHVTQIDDYGGEQRNHDLFLYCKKESGESFVVCIEAKVCEPLDSTIEERLQDAFSKPYYSKIPNRIKDIQVALQMKDINISDLRYQLFTGLAGTYKEAEECMTKDCLFLVLQILPEKTIERRNEKESLKRNHLDVLNFLEKNKAIKLTESNMAFTYKINYINEKIDLRLGYLQIKENHN